MKSWISIPPTLVDSYYYYVDGDFDAETEKRVHEELVAQARREPKPPTEAMLLGRAFHEAIELQTCHVIVDGMQFIFDDRAVSRVLEALPPDPLKEIWGTLELPEIYVRMRLRVDSLWGTRIDDIKATSRPDVDRYQMSVQWRAYLLAFGAQTFVHHICRLYQYSGDLEWKLTDYLPVTNYAYRNMRRHLIERVLPVREWLESITDARTIR